ncbi:MAG: RluA family pseudouridine synthase [Simkania negevensis]|nr:RluA family pseudouridine synthase [Simkania negevensis]
MKETKNQKVIFEEELPLRLDKALLHLFPSYSRSYFQFLIEEKAIKVNGLSLKKKDLVEKGDQIEVFFLELSEIALTPQEIPLEILYEDESILCINKPSGMVVHPAPGNPKDTFANAFLYHCKNLEIGEDPLRPGIVHRLDKETSGVLIAAKTRKAHQQLISDFTQRKVEKKYLAITIGNPKVTSLSAPIGRDPKDRQKMSVVSEKGKEAKTFFTSLKVGKKLSLIECRPITGRTHQIRVHLKELKAPVLGDSLYGSEKINQQYSSPRHLLHALSLTILHPITKEALTFEAPLPDDFKCWIEKI